MDTEINLPNDRGITSATAKGAVSLLVGTPLKSVKMLWFDYFYISHIQVFTKGLFKGWTIIKAKYL